MDNSSNKIESTVSKIENEEEKKGLAKSLTPEKIKILVAVAFGNLCVGSCYSLMAPIFPPEAERKKVSPAVYGLVFGLYQLVCFLSSPVYGKLIPILKKGFIMKAGMLVSGICNILFGFLEYVPAGPFIWLAIGLRCIDALGASAFLTASYTTLGCELPDFLGRAMSFTETAFALGLSGGPVLGGFLYELGGFRLPFIVLGTLLILVDGMNFILFKDNDTEIAPKPVSAMKLLSDFDFLIDVLSISTCFACMVFNESSLEPHVRQFNLSPGITGVIFLISGITDALASPVWGYFAEKISQGIFIGAAAVDMADRWVTQLVAVNSNPQYLTFIGALLFVICYLLVGPVSFLNFPTILWVTIFSQFLMGLAMASNIVCSYTHGMKHTVDRGFPNEVGTFSLISGILFSAACFGAFVGPSLGGYLISEIGYIHTTEAYVGMELLVASICAGRFMYLHYRTKRNSEEKSKI